MRRRLLAAAALLVLAGAACDAGPGAGAGSSPGGGRLVAERVAKRTTTLWNGPAQASYCPSDSLMLIMAIGSDWTSGFAVRVVLPLIQERTFQVQRVLGGVGTATAAFRPLGTGPAQLGVGGSLRLEPSRTINGRFDVAAPDSGGVHVSIRGRWSRVPLHTTPAGSCTSP
jgi:hypothetical protein